MNNRSGRSTLLCTLIAGLWAMPVAAAERAAAAERHGPHTGLGDQALSDEALDGMRARYIPPGSTVIVQIGNGDNTSTTYYQRDSATPGSATVTVTGTTAVTAFAATGGPGTSLSVSRTLSVTRSFGTRF